MDPFRAHAARCALCHTEVDPAELAPLTGLAACQRCRSGDMATVERFAAGSSR